MWKYVFFLLLSVSLFASCKSKKSVAESASSNNEEQAKGISREFVEISKTSMSGIEKPENLLIDNADQWKEFWLMVHKNQQPVPEVQGIDFSTHIVLAACMGMKNSGGHNTEISELRVHEGKALVTVVESSPGKGCMATMAITYPIHIVSLDKEGIKEAVFTVEERVNDCN